MRASNFSGHKTLIPKGVWEDDEGKRFWDCRMCFECEKDWDELTDAQYERFGEACVVYECLQEKIWKALEEGILEEDHRLARKWFSDAAEEETRVPDERQLTFQF